MLSPGDWVARSDEPTAAEVGEGMVLLSLATARYVSLNETASAVWRRLVQPMRVVDLSEAVADDYEVAPEVCLPAVIDCIERLIEAGVVDVSGQGEPSSTKLRP
jgi:hypothetical protein